MEVVPPDQQPLLPIHRAAAPFRHGASGISAEDEVDVEAPPAGGTPESDGFPCGVVSVPGFICARGLVSWCVVSGSLFGFVFVDRGVLAGAFFFPPFFLLMARTGTAWGSNRLAGD